jgi:phosphate transport system substrate-binding protein
MNYKPTEAGAYPLTLVTYEIVCDKGNKAETLPATKSFLGYIASEDGQKQLADAKYAPIPEEIITKVRETVSQLS